MHVATGTSTVFSALSRGLQQGSALQRCAINVHCLHESYAILTSTLWVRFYHHPLAEGETRGSELGTVAWNSKPCRAFCGKLSIQVLCCAPREARGNAEQGSPERDLPGVGLYIHSPWLWNKYPKLGGLQQRKVVISQFKGQKSKIRCW
jgi:hypothetical protein